MSTRCLYDSSFRDFCSVEPGLVRDTLNGNYHGDVPTTSREAWEEEIRIMQTVLEPWREEDGHIIFEYDIPRLGKRVDVVLLWRGIIFCMEFKVGESKILQTDVEQVLDYALDLKNFHSFSHNRLIVPLLIATKYMGATKELQMSVYDDSIVNPLVTGEKDLQSLLTAVIARFEKEKFTPIEKNWIISPYSPTPTIIEAARTLYENHSVENITRHEADTTASVNYILDVIQQSKKNRQKSICFVTGVPGAGKTLVGLDIAVKQTYKGQDKPVENESAVYLSGNGPLVAVLSEALARDNYERYKKKKKALKKDKEKLKELKSKTITDSRREVMKFIQIIHRYRDDMLAKIKNPVENGILEIDPAKAIKLKETGYAPIEHVAIFDEAQRSWTHNRIAAYLKRGGTYGNKIKVPNFPMSEAAFLIWTLDQREDWATIVCLVGGGQEINTGEAGIAEWIDALNERYPHWKVYISNKLTEPEYAEGKVGELLKDNPNVVYSDSLHLSVSLRSFRAEKLSAFVHSLLALQPDAADIYAEIKEKYPIFLTRNMDKAREWLRMRALGSERTGVLITKEAARYKPNAVHVLEKGDENAVHWFLDDIEDVRASNFLEDAATEIQVQGLELDYACVLWDADMRFDGDEWRFFTFRVSDKNTDWGEIQLEKNDKKNQNPARVEKMRYMLNAYRVLLTRARMGMVICVPEGNSNKLPGGFWEDKTRHPGVYNGTYNYLKSLGIPEL